MSLSLRRSELLRKCIEVIDTFDPGKTTVDAYMDDAPCLKDKRIGDVEHKFIHQIFYGCNRYQKFLKLFVMSFLYKCPSTALRSEQTLYTILAYLIFFRLEELGVAEFRLFLNSGIGTTPALLALLEYALCVESLEKWVKMEWCKLYEVRYIEEDIIDKLQTFALDLQPVVEEVKLKATGKISADDKSENKARERKMKSPKPFNLTQPKPRLIPEPEVISREVKALPVPAAIHKTSLAEVEAAKKKRLEDEKEKVQRKYPSESNFKFDASEARRNPTELEELAMKVEAERFAECTFKPAPAKEWTPPTETAVVKQNAAAVLREDALLKKKQAQEYEMLKRYEQELHDASTYHEWQQQMREKDKSDEEKRVYQRMVEAQLAREEAVEAYKDMGEQRRIIGQCQREEFESELASMKIEREVEHQGKRKLVDLINEEKEKNIAAAIEQVLEHKKAIAEEVKEELKLENERYQREKEHELEQKKELIRQIRALLAVPVERVKKLDKSEAPCHGLLEEMSLAELEERYKTVKSQRNQEIEEKHERQLQAKLQKQDELAEKAETLARVREIAKTQAMERKKIIDKKNEELRDKQQQHRDKCIEDMAAKIQAKKAKRRAEQMEEIKKHRERVTKQQFLQANAELREAKAHCEQQDGLEREARCRQTHLLTEQRKLNQIRSKEAIIRINNRQNDQSQLESIRNDVQQRYEKALKVNDNLIKTIDADIKAARKSQRDITETLRSTLGHGSSKYTMRVGTNKATSF